MNGGYARRKYFRHITAGCTNFTAPICMDVRMLIVYSPPLAAATRGDVPAVLCACKYYQLPILHGFARDAVHVRFFRMQILSPRSGTFRKFLMKPHVTHSIPLAYDFHRHEVTYIAAELFLTYRSTPISKEIIVSHHTCAIISRGLYTFYPIFHCGL